MRRIWMLLSILFLWPPWALAANSLEAFVSTEKAYIWKTPGYSWTDCRPLDSNSKYKSSEDQMTTIMRFNTGGKEACEAREHDDLLSAGDAVQVLQNEKGDPIFETHEILIGGVLMKKKFYRVKFNGRSGWMSQDQITRPEEKEVVKLQFKKEKRYCPPKSKSVNAPLTAKINAQELAEAVATKMPLGASKSDQEIDHYMCLYHDGRINDFESTYKRFRKSAQSASQAFGVPYGMLMCTMLVESGLYYNPKEDDEYKGLSQFGSALVFDLQKATQRAPFREMWNRYQSINPRADISDQAVRSSANPDGPVAAAALAYQWIYRERMKHSSCRDCSLPPLSRKELYTLVAGYNWSPYGLQKLVHKSADQLQMSPPPPRETRNYMVRMENCLEKGYEASFRDEALPKRHRKPAGAEKKVYRSRVEKCDQLYPVK